MAIPKMWRSRIFEKHFSPAENAGKTGFLAFFQDFIISFFWFFAQRRVLAMAKTWSSPIFEKKFFSGRKCWKYAGKTGFWHFFEISSLVLSDFLLKMRISYAQSVAESDFWENCFSGRKSQKYAGNRRFWRFSSDFFLIFLCFFHTKTLLTTMPTIKHGSAVNKTDFWSWNFLDRRNSRFSPEKRHFLNFSSCTLYYFMKFCTLMRNGNI